MSAAMRIREPSMRMVLKKMCQRARRPAVSNLFVVQDLPVPIVAQPVTCRVVVSDGSRIVSKE